MDRRVHLKVKIKSLAAEAAIIRKEEARYKGQPIAGSLYSHRTRVVRSEQRHSLIAYAFIRGKRYNQTEVNVKREPDWDKVKKLVASFGGYGKDKGVDDWRKEVVAA